MKWSSYFSLGLGGEEAILMHEVQHNVLSFLLL